MVFERSETADRKVGRRGKALHSNERFFRSSDRKKYIMESLILAQNERWRRVLSMQVERQGGAILPRAADW